MDNQQMADLVLIDLMGTIQQFGDVEQVYLNRIGKREVLNPLQKAITEDLNECLPFQQFESLGIRRIVVNGIPGVAPVAEGIEFSNNWSDFKKPPVIERLRMVFESCAIIQFEDWANVYNASDFWYGLLSDVIRPLKKKDFRFMFSLGNPINRPVFETDEILDLVSEYAAYGKVTLVLDECDADGLWCKLNGLDAGLSDKPLQATIEKYQSIFKTMCIDVLVVFCTDSTVLISKEQQFEFERRPLKLGAASKHARDCFDAGYQLGLLLQLKAPHCVALGLTISGSQAGKESAVDQNTLFNYIKWWKAGMKDLVW